MDNKAKAKLIRAEKHIEKNWLLAEDILLELLEDYPKLLKAYEMLYFIYMKHKLFRKAEHIIEKGLIELPENSQLYFLMGNIFLSQQGKAQKALDWYKKITIQTPEMLFNKSVALVYLGHRKEGIACFKEALPYFNNLPSSYTFLAEQYIALKEYDNALSVLKSAEKKFPINKDVILMVAKCYDKKKNWIQAYLYYDKAANLGQDSAEFFNNFAHCCYNIGEFEKAVAHFKDSISKNIFYIKSYIDLSKIYIAERDFTNAKKYLKIAHKIDPLNIYITLASERLRRIFNQDEDKL
ncbi:MAG TPA: hypothetical protein ENG70_04805 [Candidatus Cloacimonetes bacterium]|nr:hypothetical protein [Candidatus Cloacimonadota bacterium]HEX38158.1 hypothetical protein [Candidatus Cloacimonadota bacterium]